MRYGTVEGPGLIQLNMAVSRTFGIGESARFSCGQKLSICRTISTH
jgi:hypothetical protein